MTTPKRSHLPAMAEKLTILVTKLLVAGACSWHVPATRDATRVP